MLRMNPSSLEVTMIVASYRKKLTVTMSLGWSQYDLNCFLSTAIISTNLHSYSELEDTQEDDDEDEVRFVIASGHHMA